MGADRACAIAAALLICSALASAAEPPADSAPATEEAPAPAAEAAALSHLPALNARDLGGRPVRTLHSGGKHTLLNFYFSGCVPCIREVPALNAFRAAHPELNYLAVTFDPAFDARAFVAERRLDWPVVADAARFLRAAGVRSFPGYMLVAPDGRIVGRRAGLLLNARERTPGLASLEKFVDGELGTPE